MIEFPQNDEDFFEAFQIRSKDLRIFGELWKLMSQGKLDGHPFSGVWLWTSIGLFQSSWRTIDLLVDMAIGRFLGTPAEQTHLVCSGMMFGKKIRLLRALVAKSSAPEREALLRILNNIQNKLKRDILTHSFAQITDDGKIQYMERTSGGDFQVVLHTFSRPEFTEHLFLITNLATDLHTALGTPSHEEIDDFIGAAVTASRKPPREKASTGNRGPVKDNTT